MAARPGAGFRWLESLGPHKIRPGLLRTRALLDSLGNPSRSFRSILIAGTNGKGSTAATASAILHAAGLSVGLYTSPHLVRVNERFRIADEDVDDAALDDVLGLLAAIAPPGDLQPTYFEALTVAAFELFRRAKVEIAVVEVGLGGRLDATNVLLPEVSVVTNVGHDHLAILGPALADVAREKAGIFRQGQPAFTAATGEGLAVLHEEARRARARLQSVAPSDRFDAVTPLAGAHQRSNVALAVAAVSAVAPLGEEAVRFGVSKTRWPGRLQLLRREGRRAVLLDGAHNPEGAEALAAHLATSGLSGRVDLVFGGLSDKDLPAMLATLRPHVSRLVLITLDSPRAARAQDLAARIPPPFEIAETLKSAIDGLEDRDARGPILVTGSLVLVGAALELLGP